MAKKKTKGSKARNRKLKSAKAKAVRSVKKRAGKKLVSKRGAAKVKRLKIDEKSLEKIAEVTHYFPKVKAAAAMILKDSLKVGDQIYIKGHTTDFKEPVKSIQLDRVPIQEGKKGQEIGLLVKSRVRIGDTIYRINP